MASRRTSPVPLRAVEAAYLAFESSDAPMHMGAVAQFEAGPLLDDAGRLRIEDLRRGIESRLHLVPRLRQKVRRSPLSPPVWVDDADFDLSRHVHGIAAPHPGGETELLDLVRDLMAIHLDRERPLWELWFVEGVAGDRVALVEKIHHALADGMGGVELAAVLLDLEPVTTIPDPVPWTPSPDPGALGLGAGAVRRAVGAPGRLVADAAKALRRPARLARRARSLAASAPVLLRDALRSGTQSLNRPIGPHRRLVPLRLPVSTARSVAHAAEVTVNDVVLGAVTGGLRALLDQRGEPVNRLTLTALVPVSVRGDDEKADLGNLTSALFVPLPVHARDPAERLALVHDATARRKDLHEDEAVDSLLSSGDRAPRALAALARWVVPRQPFVTLVVTNMRGPDVPLYALGARMLDVLPIVPLGGNLDVGVAILSYLDTLAITIHADPDRCRDVDVFADGTARAFDELASQFGVTGSRRARSA